MRIPWWVNPWGAMRGWRQVKADYEERIDSLCVTAQQDIEMISELEKRCSGLEAGRRHLAVEVNDLRRQLAVARALPDGMPSDQVPEFVFIGIPKPDGTKRLWASKDLAGTAFTMTGMNEGPPRWKIGAIMANNLTTDGPDYSACIRRVLEIWANWLNARKLPAGEQPYGTRTGPLSISQPIQVREDPDMPPGQFEIRSGENSSGRIALPPVRKEGQ